MPLVMRIFTNLRPGAFKRPDCLIKVEREARQEGHPARSSSRPPDPLPEDFLLGSTSQPACGYSHHRHRRFPLCRQGPRRLLGFLRQTRLLEVEGATPPKEAPSPLKNAEVHQRSDLVDFAFDLFQ
jgi:hypothetical protein